MSNIRLRFVLGLFLACGAGASAQQSKPATQASGRMRLEVVVTTKSGARVSGLQQQDFTLFDNKVKQSIVSLDAIDGRQSPIEFIVVIDSVNAGATTVAFERDQIDKFLHADAGRLAHPTSIAVLTDTGMQIVKNFSSDGNDVSSSLDQYTGSLRTFRRSAGFFNDTELFQISLAGMHNLAAREGQGPGRKIILWVSPGWPLLSGPEVELSAKQQQELFEDVVGFSDQFIQGNITLYSIDPLGPNDIGFRTFFWKEFLKGVSKQSQVEPGNLALQVLATQSGGLALNSSNNIAGLLQQSAADTGAYYEISFDPPPGDKPNEYHAIEVRVGKPGLTARTRQGYYLQP